MLDKDYRNISGIILDHFKPLLHYILELWNHISVCFGHPIVNSYFRYQSSTRVLDNKLDKVLEPYSPNRILTQCCMCIRSML